MPKRDISDDVYDYSYTNRGSGGKGACDWSKHSGPVKFYKPKDSGYNKFNIIPFVIRTNLHPLVRAGKKKVGDLVYNLDVMEHRKIGPGKESVLCPAQFGKFCPVCEAQQKAYKDGDSEAVKLFTAKRRVYYNIVDMLDPEEGVQVLDVSHFLFEKELISAAKRKGEEGAIVRFSSPDAKVGKIIKVYTEKEKSGGFETIKFKDFEFLNRTEDTDRYIDEAVSFDDLLTLLSPEDITAIMMGVDPDEIEVAEENPEELSRPQHHEEPVVEEEKKPVCPVTDGIFGKDFEKFKKCENCSLWKQCYKENTKF